MVGGCKKCRGGNDGNGRVGACVMCKRREFIECFAVEDVTVRTGNLGMTVSEWILVAGLRY